MNITIFGTGYVGLVTGSCFAAAGNNVVCVDVDRRRIDQLNAGEIPIYEPGLDTLIKQNSESGNLRFTTDNRLAVSHGVVQFIAVGTPANEDGSADLRYVVEVAEIIAAHMTEFKLVINKSTVPVGTAKLVTQTIGNLLKKNGTEINFDVVSNPEFLKEGSAINDFMKPDRIVVGTDSDHAYELIQELYSPFNRNHERIIRMDTLSAEMTKYAANAMLATKISFMNELANIAEIVGADIEKIRHGIGSDSRIGYHFIYPGCGYGGSCFPKDMQALTKTADQIGYQAELLQAVEAVNTRQKNRLFEKIKEFYGEGLTGKTLAIWGLSFKPNTNDMREAPSRTLIDALLQSGAKIQAYDPVAMHECQQHYGSKLDLLATKEAALRNADALVICTEWKQFWAPDFALIRNELKDSVIFDGRNLFEPNQVASHGITYHSIGRKVAVKQRPLDKR